MRNLCLVLGALLALAGCAARPPAPWAVHIAIKDQLGRRGPPPLLIYEDPAYRVGTPVVRQTPSGTLRFVITVLDDGDHLLDLTFTTTRDTHASFERQVRLQPGYGLRADTARALVDIQPLQKR